MVNLARNIKKVFGVIFVLIIFLVAASISNINQKGYNSSSFLKVNSIGGVRSYNILDVVAFSKKSNIRYAYIGGFPIGISLKTDGILVEHVDEVNTVFGKSSLKNYIQSGDMILSLANKETNYADDLVKILEDLDSQTKEVDIKILRGKEHLEFKIGLLIEEFSGKFKLGLRVKDSVSGIGTVSFIKEDGSFGALGHPICNFSSGEPLTTLSGNVYDCKVMGVNRSGRGRPGELKATLRNTDSPIGEISKNNKYGIFGKLKKEELEKVLEQNSNSTLYEVGERSSINPGKAQILTTVGEKTEFYDIEIIKASYQSSRNDKSMVIRVTDKRLLEITGGVIQGMSGSPIIQDKKLIGAVTHVFVNDPCKGYGIYLDWMYL